jgi:HTH-type transcriptional regulator, competence development regulator
MTAFNKYVFSALIVAAKKDRSLNQFALQTKIDAGYLSRLINCKRKNPPTPNVIRKIAEKSNGRVTYAELMIAAGYSG